MVCMVGSKLALFLSGLFFGGAIDPVIRASMGPEFTPYGIRSGVRGNWGLAILDGGLAVLLYMAHRRRDQTDRTTFAPSRGTCRRFEETRLVCHRP